jgi:hypothetical protein
MARAFKCVLFGLVACAHAVQTTSDRRVRHHKHHHEAEHSTKPLQSLSELLSESRKLTKEFQHNAEVLREKVKRTEDPDSESPNASLIQVASEKKADKPVGLQAMEAVTDQIMAFTDRMRKLGNDAALFSS